MMTETENVQIARIDERQQQVVFRLEKLEHAMDAAKSLQIRILWALLILALGQVGAVFGLDKVIGLLK